LSEKYRTPVILLADEIVGHMREKITVYDGERNIRGGYRNAVLSPQYDFFTGNNTLVEGQLHDEAGRRVGHIASKSSDFIKSIHDKILNHVDEISEVEAFFTEDAEIAILAYGSVSRSALNAVKSVKGIRMETEQKDGKKAFIRNLLKKNKNRDGNPYSHLKVGLIKVNTVWPFPEKEIRRLAGKCRYVFVPEMNMGKYYKEVERCLKNCRVVSLPKVGGEIHSPSELLALIAGEVERHE
jgi:2-oxoglutarate ferredoxin oxidoreductase subunit alpha